MKILQLAFITLFLPFLFSGSTTAQPMEYNDFSRIPVQHEGRIKPLDSFARDLLRLIAGHESLDGMNADEWLAESLFDPAQALQRPIFRLLKPNVIGLENRESRYYSYAEIAPALEERAGVIRKLAQSDEKNLSEDQREMLRIHDAALVYMQLLRSFSLLLPLNVEPPAFLKISPEKAFTLEEYRKHQKILEDRLKKIIKEKGADPSLYTKDEMRIADFAFKMKTLEAGGSDNLLFRILPGRVAEWFSPWMIGESGEGSPENAAYLDLWKKMAYAYVAQDAKDWNTLTKQAADQGQKLAPQSPLETEILYNKTHPLTAATLLYFAALLLWITLSFKESQILERLTEAALAGGILFHLLAITARVVILSRPPVGTLYESILFVALICAIVGFVYGRLKKDETGWMIGASSGAGLLFLAQGFAQDNTMPMLTAVLNTNFWLATHVLCITIGYAWCLVTSMVAHLWLYQRVRGKNADSLLFPLKTLVMTSLLFTAVGTILGGIWADQSWGRFWGWDPKENGALLIVLWLTWVFHGQIAGRLNRLQSGALYAGLSVVVAIAWFGVNLLSTGLHSYGFISGVATGLAAFCLAEIALITTLYHVARKQDARA